ncbi:Integral membrane protein GPR155 [Araneus ventricosus]|uniref:Integral membrane protein GPR155 n=1 Tax=Araneus ventricosus TaxID=182803 RepID=A0A4Y2AAH2_ARAVE|nr:Integral membrane protein GPR155 [Araneus ventricosus]
MGQPGISLEDTLLPSLVQCFGIIFIGYILGKSKILRQTEAQGLSIFIQYLSLPALIFVTVSTIPFTQMKWVFIASVFVSKTCVFVSVALITMLLTHPCDLGKAGIYAIFATQSNDFALGFPLFTALYQNTHPEYPMYLYIIAPIQLLILNTIGFIFLESEKHHRDMSQNGSHLYHVIKGTIQNPVVIMTVVGLIWNITYGQKVLPIFDNILKAFSSAFPATALLLLGYTMTITSKKSDSQISVVVTTLIFLKNLVLPLIMQQSTRFFLQDSSTKEVESLGSFGFLYGILPTAPSVYVFATQYDRCIDVATKTVVGSTIFSAPLLFATASVISLSQIGIEHVTSYLSITISYLSSQIYLRRNAAQHSTHTLFDDRELESHHVCSSEATTSKTICCEDIEDIGRNVKEEHRSDYHSMANDSYDRVCDSKYHCSAARRQQCTVQVSRYIDDNNEIGTGLIDDEYFLKHITLLILFSVPMIMSIFVCLWKLIEIEDGIYIELEFLDVIVNYTLGIVCFIMFGLDGNLLYSILKKLNFCSSEVPPNTLETIESKIICEKFLLNYYEICKKDIEQTRIINNEEYQAVFEYTELVNWLLEAEVAATNKDAEYEIECLIKTFIIEELNESCYTKRFFRFTNRDALTI